jgi:hypothetical protein
MKQLILVLFAATFSLSVAAGKPTKDQITEASCKFSIDQKGTKFSIDEAGVKRQATPQQQKQCEDKYGKGVVMQRSAS